MLTSSFTSCLRLLSIMTLRAHRWCSVAKPSILIWKIGQVQHWMTIAWIIEWILLQSWNEYCLCCFINLGENRMRIKANLSNFSTTLSNVFSKMKYTWILLSICGNYQMHISDIAYWHISATILMGLLYKEVLHHTKRLYFIFLIGNLNRFLVLLSNTSLLQDTVPTKALAFLVFSRAAFQFRSCFHNCSGMALVFETTFLQPVIGAFETGSVYSKYSIFLYGKRSVNSNAFIIYVQY